jgi:hypothetical protein
MSNDVPDDASMARPMESVDAADAASAEGAAPARGPNLRLSPFCVHLQSKKLFFADAPPQAIDDVLDASRHCWCRKTMQVIGPDGEFVDPRDCQSGRSCFESIL